jgi:hypothetical protein
VSHTSLVLHNRLLRFLYGGYGTLKAHFVLERESLMPPKTAAIPQEEIELRLHAIALLGQDIRTFLRTEGWNRLGSRNAQVAFLLEFAATDCGIQLPSPPRSVWSHAVSCPHNMRKSKKNTETTLSSAHPFTASRGSGVPNDLERSAHWKLYNPRGRTQFCRNRIPQNGNLRLAE